MPHLRGTYDLFGCDVALVETSKGVRRAYYRPRAVTNAWIRVLGYAWRLAPSGRLTGYWRWHTSKPAWGSQWSMTSTEGWLWNTCLPRATTELTEQDLNIWLGHRNEMTWHEASRQWLLLDDPSFAGVGLGSALTTPARTRRRAPNTLRQARRFTP